MKKIYVAFILVISITSAFADSWVQKASLANSIVRGVGFSIGNKGYIATGEVSGSPVKTLWQYNPANNSWSQKADFGGVARMDAVGFSIDDNGYIGTGWNGSSSLYNDFWAYDTTANSWSQKGNFPGGQRQSATGFSIGAKGYVGTGVDAAFNFYSDFWVYDPLSGWVQKSDFPITAAKGTGFSIGGYGYLGVGMNDNGNLNSFYQYDTLSDTWTKKTDFGGSAREGTVGFSIGNYGYIGTGFDGSNKNDFWQYDPGTDTWAQKASLTGASRSNAVAFSIGNTGYIGTGTPGLSDFWEYTPDSITTGIDQNNRLSNVCIYPNPVNDQFAIYGLSFAGKTTINIYNALGIKIYSAESVIFNSQSAIKIDVSSFANGAYVLVLEIFLDNTGNPRNQWVTRIIKE